MSQRYTAQITVQEIIRVSSSSGTKFGFNSPVYDLQHNKNGGCHVKPAFKGELGWKSADVVCQELVQALANAIIVKAE